MVKLIVIAQNVESISEFQQIIGRGTRLNPHLEELGKHYFSILDFTGATEFFSNKDFDAIANTQESFPPQKPRKNDNISKKIFIEDIPVYIVKELGQILDSDGKLISCDFVAYTKDKFTSKYSLESFLQEWNKTERKKKLLAEFEDQGILIEELRAMDEYKNCDEFDILLSLGFNKKLISRKDRAKNAKKILEKYQGKAREVIEILLEKYATKGITEIENPEILTLKPFTFESSHDAILESFGDVKNYNAMLKELEFELYKIA